MDLRLNTKEASRSFDTITRVLRDEAQEPCLGDFSGAAGGGACEQPPMARMTVRPEFGKGAG